ncbi:hypothetical protein JCM9534A_66930 [Catenuloplanes indicus JCM 9534]
MARGRRRARQERAASAASRAETTATGVRGDAAPHVQTGRVAEAAEGGPGAGDGCAGAGRAGGTNGRRAPDPAVRDIRPGLDRTRRPARGPTARRWIRYIAPAPAATPVTSARNSIVVGPKTIWPRTAPAAQRAVHAPADDQVSASIFIPTSRDGPHRRAACPGIDAIKHAESGRHHSGSLIAGGNPYP